MRSDRRRKAAAGRKPRLLVFCSKTDGPSRRLDAFLAQVLQRRHNHDAFLLSRIDRDARPDLHERFRITVLPTLVVVAENRVVRRIVKPRGCAELELLLEPWLHGSRGEPAADAPEPAAAYSD